MSIVLGNWQENFSFLFLSENCFRHHIAKWKKLCRWHFFFISLLIPFSFYVTNLLHITKCSSKNLWTWWIHFNPHARSRMKKICRQPPHVIIDIRELIFIRHFQAMKSQFFRIFFFSFGCWIVNEFVSICDQLSSNRFAICFFAVEWRFGESLESCDVSRSSPDSKINSNFQLACSKM